MIDEKSVIGKGVQIFVEAEILESNVGEDVFVDKYTRVEHSTIEECVRLERNNQIVYSKLGRYSYTGTNTVIKNATIGKFTSIAWNVSIGGNTHDMNHVTLHSFLVYPKWNMGGNGNWKSCYEKCEVGNDVWIGAGANILRNVTIGDGAIIGAGSIVTKDVEPYTIVVGNPARAIKMRCKEEWIEDLQALRWWDFPADIIRENLSLFQAELNLDVIKQMKEIRYKLDESIKHEQ